MHFLRLGKKQVVQLCNCTFLARAALLILQIAGDDSWDRPESWAACRTGWKITAEKSQRKSLTRTPLIFPQHSDDDKERDLHDNAAVHITLTRSDVVAQCRQKKLKHKNWNHTTEKWRRAQARAHHQKDEKHEIQRVGKRREKICISIFRNFFLFIIFSLNFNRNYYFPSLLLIVERETSLSATLLASTRPCIKYKVYHASPITWWKNRRKIREYNEAPVEGGQ